MVPNTSPAKKICLFESCPRGSVVRGMCRAHYKQWSIGKPLAHLGKRSISDHERFEQKVIRGDDCWDWVGAKTTSGYGHFALKGRSQPAHRVSYLWKKGEIPEGMQIDHICHNRACVNPEHLRLVTIKQNAENKSGARSDSSTGVRGVYPIKERGTFRATVGHKGKRLQVGYFKTIEEANRAVVKKRNELHTHNNLDRI